MEQSKLGVASRPRWSAWLASPRLGRIAQLVLSLFIVLASSVPLARFIGIALQRLNYPLDLEWCEGGTLGHIRVVLEGQSMYRAPSFDFTPYIYPPLYYYVSALPSLVLGVGLFAPRLVSFVSILGCFVLLGRWVRDETEDAVAGMAAIGLFCATYQLTGYWFDLARVDAFFLLLVFAANTLARTAATPWRAVWVGVLIAASCYTKQLGIPLALPPLLWLAMRSLRLGIIAALVSGGIIAVVGVAFNVTTHGWFFYYVLDLPSRHELEWVRFWPSLQQFFLSTTFPMTLAGIATICGLGFAARDVKRWIYHAAFIGIACASSFLPFLKSGGYPNGLIPAYVALALACGLALGSLRKSKFAVALGPGLAACALVALQLLVLNYDPTPALPTAADAAANETVLRRLDHLRKPLFVTGSSVYAMADGRPVVTDTMGLIDILKGSGPQAKALQAKLASDLRRHRFKTIVVDRAFGFLPGEIVELIQQNYAPKGSVLDGLPPNVIWPTSGAALRPDGIWVARR